MLHVWIPQPPSACAVLASLSLPRVRPCSGVFVTIIHPPDVSRPPRIISIRDDCDDRVAALHKLSSFFKISFQLLCWDFAEALQNTHCISLTGYWATYLMLLLMGNSQLFHLIIIVPTDPSCKLNIFSCSHVMSHVTKHVEAQLTESGTNSQQKLSPQKIAILISFLISANRDS